MNIDETNIFFDMGSGLSLAHKGNKIVLLKSTGTSMRGTLFFEFTSNGEELTPLVVSRDSQMGELPGHSMGCQHP